MASLEASILAYEGAVRLGIFLAVLAIVLALEWALPRRRLTQSRRRRWAANFGIVVIDSLMLRLAFPILAVGLAIVAADRGWGLFNIVGLPVWLEVLASVILLDALIYWQHRLFHTVPLLWRLHRMHHADLDFDVSTALRFHPLEIALSMLIKMAAVLLLGPSALAVIVFEVLLNGTAMFNHGNLRLPGWLDRALRKVIVTPDFHRVHHSVRQEETNSNYGFNLTWWDYLFGSYRGQPHDGHTGMTIGLAQYRDAVCASLVWMLLLPFRNGSGRTVDRGRHGG